MRGRLLAAGVAVAVVAVVGGVAIVHSRSSVQQGPEATAVESAFVRAVAAQQQIGVLIPGAGPSPVAGRVSPELADEDAVARRRTASAAQLGAVFTGPALDRELATSRDYLAGYEKDLASSDSLTDFLVDGGAGNARFRKVAVSGGSAVVSARVDSWLVEGTVRDDKVSTVTPRNDIDATAHLVRAAGGSWQVDDLTWRFAPGSEP